jgi:hypothetical protein
MADIDDLWINALAALPDVQPLVRLLRSDTPMPPGARDLLAELLSPADPPISDFELIPKRIKKFDTMLDQLEKVAPYAQEREAEQSAQAAAIEACPYRKSNPGVLKVQPAEDGPRLDSSSSLNSAMNGCVLGQGQVCADCVVVVHIRRQHVAQVPLAEHDDMVKTLPTDRADQALGVAVLPRRTWRRRMVPNAERADAANEGFTVATVAVTDQKMRDLPPTRCLSQLVGNPFCGGVGGDAEPQDLSAAKTHDQQPVEKPERGGRHHEQVDRRNPVCMIAEECPLSL